MSRIGEKPVDVPAGVTVKVEGQRISAKGPQGQLSVTLQAVIRPELKDSKVALARADDTHETRSLHGLSRSLVANMLTGVTKGYSKELELQGVGFRAAVQGRKLVLTIGYSRPVEYEPPADIKVAVKESIITVSGPDKQQVGDAAARIRSFYPPEPYKGKGIRYRGEYVKRKAGKTVA